MSSSMVQGFSEANTNVQPEVKNVGGIGSSKKDIHMDVNGDFICRGIWGQHISPNDLTMQKSLVETVS